MKTKKPILIVLGEPNSIFVEILSKVLNTISIKKKITAIFFKRLMFSQYLK